MEIRNVDPADDQTMAQWHSVYAAADAAGRDFATLWMYPEFLADIRTESQFGHRLLIGYEAQTPIAAAQISIDTLANQHIAMVSPFVQPSHVRRGHGTQLLAAAEQVAIEAGCTTVNAEAGWSTSYGSTGDGWGGREFARKHGYVLGITEVQGNLSLPGDVEVWQRLAREAAPRHAAYEIRAWTGRVPDELAQGWAELEAAVETEAPMGKMEFEPESADVGALRQREAIGEAQHRVKLNCVALDATGEVVAYTDIAVPLHDPGVAYQWGTLVRRDNRGHRLGLAVKLANLMHLVDTQPQISKVVTYNAEVNAHMIGINRALGFEPVEYSGQFQKKLVGSLKAS